MLAYNHNEPQYNQTLDWTCSACSLAWLNRALGIAYATDELSAADYIGIPQNINSTYGLMDASGARLGQCLTEQGAPSFCLWPTWDQLVQLAWVMPLLIGGVAWNHWVGVRYSDAVLYLANSAPGWGEVSDIMDSSSFARLGPFAAVAVPLQRPLPSV